VQERLRDLDTLKQTLEGCCNQQLRSMLSDINRRKVRHTSRLLNWLQERNAGLENDLDGRRFEVESPAAKGGQPPEAGSAVSAGRVEITDSGYQVEVIECREVTSDLLIFKVPRPADFTFMPGQSVKLRLDGVKRSYSIVSAPHEPFLEFFVELTPGGQMSERLRRLTEGDWLTLDAPKGRFILAEQFANHLMIATVTGVNPFVSILRDYLHQGRRGHRFYLLQGASYQDEFGYKDELERIAAAHPDVLTYIPTVSRPDEPRNAVWTGEQGRVGIIIDKYLNQFGLDNRPTMIYACGNPGMVDEVEQRYRPQGFEIKTERYD
jgi:NAD(P)H-flavin reductase